MDERDDSIVNCSNGFDINHKDGIIINELLRGSEEYLNSEPSGSVMYLVDEPISSTKIEKLTTIYDHRNSKSYNENDMEMYRYLYENEEYYNEVHEKTPFLRGITLSKWPNIGFGFKLKREEEISFYSITEILSNSPAESCLNIGDLIIEIDEFDDPFGQFRYLNEIENYLGSKENIHLIALDNSNYLKFKLKNRSLKNYSNNCEDIVIVSWKQLKEEK